MRNIALYIMIFISAQVFCIEKDSVISHFLEDIVITGEKTTSPLKNSDTKVIKLDMEFLNRMPKILGNADPLRYTQMFPGIQTNSEYDAGLHIQGCENSHNLISIEGIPVYNASHLLGLFSTFNPSHFPTMSLKKSATPGDGYSRIGGIMNMELEKELPQKTNGEFSVGLISSQGTIRIPLGKKAALFTSLRISYLNLLYSPLLKIDDGQLVYNFGDINATYLQEIGDSHTIHIDLYSGFDKAKLENDNSKVYLNTETYWGNALGAAHWDYKFKKGTLKQSLYFTGYKNRLHLTGNYNVGLPSGIYDIGYHSKASIGNIDFGISLISHNTRPQTPEYVDMSIKDDNFDNRQHTIESSVFVAYKGKFLKNFHYDVALKGDLYSDLKGYTYPALNPHAAIAYDTWQSGRIELSYSLQHQYLLNCGFTSLGMPIEFWISANRENKPQLAHNFLLTYKRELFKGKFEINVEAYFKRLYNQIEYNGSPFDILNKKYSIKDIAISGDGYNYGANIMLNKLTGKLTGWVSYSFGRALRKFDIYGNKWFPANHERIHEVNVVAVYKIGKRFDIGGTFSYASGTPFTSIKYFYVINNNILTEFGEHNANRLKDYIRLDISANYDFIKNEKGTAGINLSIYNVLCRKNEIYYGLLANEKGLGFKSRSFLTTLLPSISFYYNFK